MKNILNIYDLKIISVIDSETRSATPIEIIRGIISDTLNSFFKINLFTA